MNCAAWTDVVHHLPAWQAPQAHRTVWLHKRYFTLWSFSTRAPHLAQEGAVFLHVHTMPLPGLAELPKDSFGKAPRNSRRPAVEEIRVEPLRAHTYPCPAGPPPPILAWHSAKDGHLYRYRKRPEALSGSAHTSSSAQFGLISTYHLRATSRKTASPVNVLIRSSSRTCHPLQASEKV